MLDILAFQSGVVSRQQAMAAGMTPAVIDNKLRSGRWQRLQRGVYATFSGPIDRQAELWSFALRAGPSAMLGHQTAAELYGLKPGQSRLIHLTVPTDDRLGLC